MFLYKYRFAELITTFFYIGKIKYFPGTFGSIMAFPLSYIIVYLTIKHQIFFSFSTFNHLEQELFSLFLICLIVCFILFLIGTFFSDIYIKFTFRDDPSEVVIDEVVGQMLVITLCFFGNYLILNSKIYSLFNNFIVNFCIFFFFPFFLFRVFDILKPWPINWFDKSIKGGIGIMLDDIIAALFASISYYALIFLLLDWLG